MKQVKDTVTTSLIVQIGTLLRVVGDAVSND